MASGRVYVIPVPNPIKKLGPKPGLKPGGSHLHTNYRVSDFPAGIRTPINMDRYTWMYEIPRHTSEYLAELNNFMEVAEADRVDKVDGFVEDYTCWSWHGELLSDNPIDGECNNDHNANNDNDVNIDFDSDMYDYIDNLDDVLHDVDGNIDENNYDKFQQMFVDSEKPLYTGCTKFTKLSAVLRLLNLKTNNGWSDTSFTKLLKLLHEMLPDDNELPVSLYQAKKMLCPMGLQVERIHACPNDWMLYRNEYKDLHKCASCGTSRLFSNAKDAKLLRWNADERKNDGKLRHVADSPQWRNIDDIEDFGDEIRNIRFGLSTEGINPFGNMSSRHSTWPVLLCIYNLPPWLCMKRKYLMMSLLIQGPKQPGNDIDIYLAPLIDDLKTLWSPGVKVYDSYKRENFNLRAIIFRTINDFPAYQNLSGYSTKGYKACPLCEDETSSIWLTNCKKPVYMGNRKGLPKNHPYGRKKELFDGLLLKILGKTKDRINVRKDFEEMKIRTELKPDYRGNKKFLPPACYTLSKTEKAKFCQTLHGIKVPSGYSANIKRLVSLKDNRLLGMKSHGCHVLMTQMIPIAISDILPNGVRHTITKLCLFFNMIHSKVIDPKVLDMYQKDIIITLCQLEMYFPPSFFDIMVHLVSHIIYEIKACGHVFLRYMYPFERYMGVLKGYVRNHSRPEGSIIEGYLSEEVTTFFTDYLKGARNIGLPQGELDTPLV
ncbi:uncharacterized protein [Rutidosis leptorrhynchoides]|uniref:uncharacterized protein n=1 Tax=Rutidosis leptorrhynchoides TaxID=125765 RepID=UPI003A99F7B6